MKSYKYRQNETTGTSAAFYFIHFYQQPIVGRDGKNQIIWLLWFFVSTCVITFSMIPFSSITKVVR